MPYVPEAKIKFFADDPMFLYSTMSKHHATNQLTEWLKEWVQSVAIFFVDKNPDIILLQLLNEQNIGLSQLAKYLAIKIDSDIDLHNT